jgi:hypothetical protein
MSGITDTTRNASASFLPMTAPGTLPSMEVAGARVFAYIKAGVLVVSVDLDDALGLEVGGEVPMRITVQGETVFEVGATCTVLDCAECGARAGKACAVYCIADQAMPAS